MICVETAQDFSIWKVHIRFKCVCKEGNVSLSRGCAELIYFAQFPSTPGAQPCLLWTLAYLPNMHTSVTVVAACGKADHPRQRFHRNWWLTGRKTLGRPLCAAGLSVLPEDRAELPTTIF